MAIRQAERGSCNILARVANPVVLGGDIHSHWANDLKLDFDDPTSPTVATEFVGTSITSHSPDYDAFARFLPDNPHVRYFESRWHGYASVELERERMTTRFRSVSDATDINAAVTTLRTFVVENGKPGATSPEDFLPCLRRSARASRCGGRWGLREPQILLTNPAVQTPRAHYRASRPGADSQSSRTPCRRR
jgi:hypothetical protein